MAKRPALFRIIYRMTPGTLNYRCLHCEDVRQPDLEKRLAELRDLGFMVLEVRPL